MLLLGLDEQYLWGTGVYSRVKIELCRVLEFKIDS